MKISISRIEEINEDYKPVDELVDRVVKAKKDFVKYELLGEKTIQNKLVFRNLNHRKMLHKHLMFEHFYVILLVLLVVFFLSFFSNSIVMISLAVIGLLYIPYKLIAMSETPNHLIFEGLNIYEVNCLGKRIKELCSTDVGTTKNSTAELLHITSPKRKMEKMKILVIKENDNEFESLEFFFKHFNKFNVKTNFK